MFRKSLGCPADEIFLNDRFWLFLPVKESANVAEKSVSNPLQSGRRRGRKSSGQKAAAYDTGRLDQPSINIESEHSSHQERGSLAEPPLSALAPARPQPNLTSSLPLSRDSLRP